MDWLPQGCGAWDVFLRKTALSVVHQIERLEDQTWHDRGRSQCEGIEDKFELRTRKIWFLEN